MLVLKQEGEVGISMADIIVSDLDILCVKEARLLLF
jgi:hypothetical protein